MDNPVFRIGTFFIADDDDRGTTEAAQAADDGPVFGISPVTGQRREILDQGVHVIQGMGPVRMAGNLRLLPGGQLCIGLLQKLVHLGLQFTDLFGNVDPAIIRQVAEFLDLAFQLGDGFFEFKEVMHGLSLAYPPGS